MVKRTYVPMNVFNLKPSGSSRYNQEAAACILSDIMPPELAALCAAFAANLPPLPFVSNWELWEYAEPEYTERGYYGGLPMMPLDAGNTIYHGF